jgi:hypothetical protein
MGPDNRERNQTMTSPAIKFRDGTFQVTIWRNTGDRGTYYTLNPTRSYKSGDDAWKVTDMSVDDPRYAAFHAVAQVMSLGSEKDGRNESWRQKDVMCHLSKAQSHLATHIKHLYDPRGQDEENHLFLAITRLEMALTQKS